jgi:hypothetical protein
MQQGTESREHAQRAGSRKKESVREQDEGSRTQRAELREDRREKEAQRSLGSREQRTGSMEE